MENEIWKDIEGYGGLYQVSNTGLVKRMYSKTYKYPRLLKQSERSGYLCVDLSKDGFSKTKSVHRLVAEAFVSNPQKYKIVNHKDENKKNNNADNLEWCDIKYNSLYSLNRHPERKKQLAEQFKDKKTGGLISPLSQKGTPHKYHQRVAVTNDKWEISIVFDNAAIAAQHYNIRCTNVLAACRKNKTRTYKHKTDGKIFIFLED